MVGSRGNVLHVVILFPLGFLIYSIVLGIR